MLQGNRVLLRSMRREDLPGLWEVLGDDLELRALVSSGPPLPRSLAHLEEELNRDLRQDHGVAKFVIEVEGDAIGRCELHSFDQYSRHCELGIALGRRHWGQGYGREAVRLLVDYAFDHLNMHRVQLQVLADDRRATGAYRAAGFLEEGSPARPCLARRQLPGCAGHGRASRSAGGHVLSRVFLRASLCSWRPTGHANPAPVGFRLRSWRPRRPTQPPGPPPPHRCG